MDNNRHAVLKAITDKWTGDESFGEFITGVLSDDYGSVTKATDLQSVTDDEFASRINSYTGQSEPVLTR